MPALMHFYPGLSPEAFYRLTLREHTALADYMNKYAEAMRRGK